MRSNARAEGHGAHASLAAAREPLAPRISAERVIRTTVGLRPHRDGGFVLRAEKLDDKTLIHNYGHGGAGMSLAGGCGTLVADLAQPTGVKQVAVIHAPRAAASGRR